MTSETLHKARLLWKNICSPKCCKDYAFLQSVKARRHLENTRPHEFEVGTIKRESPYESRPWPLAWFNNSSSANDNSSRLAEWGLPCTCNYKKVHLSASVRNSALFLWIITRADSEWGLLAILALTLSQLWVDWNRFSIPSNKVKNLLA